MIIFLYGEDTFRSKQKLKELKNKFSQDVDKSLLNIEKIDGEKIVAENFKQIIGTRGFLAEKRMIIIENLLSKNKSKKILKEIFNIIKKIENKVLTSKTENIIIFWEEIGLTTKKYKGKKLSGELFNYLKIKKYAFEFVLLDNVKLAVWIKNIFNSQGKDIKPEAISLFISLIGNDMWKLNNEINKLLVSEEKIINSNKIKELVNEKFNENIFELVDALTEKNKKKFFYLLEKNLKREANLSYLLSMLIRQFRTLLRAKSILQNNPYINLSVELKVPFFIERKIKKQIDKYSLKQLKKIYGQLMTIDSALKEGYFNPELLFYKLII